MIATLCQTLVVLSGTDHASPHLARAREAIVEELAGEALQGPSLSQQIEKRLSRPAGDPIAPQDVAVLREAVDALFRLYAEGAWSSTAEALERMRARILASPITLTTDLSLRQCLYEVRIMLAECYRRLERDADATATMAELLRSAPNQTPSAILFSPDVLDFFKKVKHELDAQPRGSLEIVTTPPGLAVYVSGEYVGSSPVRIGDLYPGAYPILVGTGAQTMRMHQATVQSDERVVIDQDFDSVLRTGDAVGFLFPDDSARTANEAFFAARVGRALGAHEVIVLASTTHRGQASFVGSLIDVDTARPRRTGIVATEPSPPTATAFHALGRFLLRGGSAPGIVTSDHNLTSAPEQITHTASLPIRFRISRWVALGASLAGVAATSVFFVADGSCSEQTRSGACVSARDLHTPAIVSASISAAAALTAGILFSLGNERISQ